MPDVTYARAGRWARVPVERDDDALPARPPQEAHLTRKLAAATTPVRADPAGSRSPLGEIRELIFQPRPTEPTRGHSAPCV